MARPKKNNADYFSHDADMRNDNKVKALRRKYGLEGYAIWNMLIEHLTDCDFFEYEYTELNIELLAGDFDVEPSFLKEVITYLTRLKMLKLESGFISCEKLKERFESLLNKRVRNNAKPKLKTSKTSKKTVSDVENPQSKVKESKVKESKVNKTIEERKAEFKNSLLPFLSDYSKELLNEFFEYWTEHGERDKKMRFEKQNSFGLSRRLATWLKNQKRFEKEKKVAPKKEKVNAGELLKAKYGIK